MAKVALIDICGVILPEAYIWYDEEATSLYRVKQQIQAAGEFDEIQLNICSPGGYCREGWSIVDYLYGLGKKINTLAYGQCASFGTVFHAMGEVRETTRFCEWMYHRPWDYTYGNNLQIAKFNVGLAKETTKLFGFYAERFTKPLDEVETLIQEDDLYLDPQECVDYGFATGIYMAGPVAALASDKPGFNTPLDPAKKQKPLYLMTLGDRKVNPDAPKEEALKGSQSNLKTNTMAEKKQSLIDAAKSVLAFLQGSNTKALDVPLEDGRTLVTNSTGDAPVVGDTAKIDDEAAPNGDYASADYGTLTVTDGSITAITEDTTEETTDEGGSSDVVEEPATVVALKKQYNELKAKYDKLETRQQEAETRMKAVLGNLISKEPITQANKIADKEKGKGTKELSDREKMLADHVAQYAPKPPVTTEV